jgi:ACS family hexuronate transporter-like MFS transporter
MVGSLGGVLFQPLTGYIVKTTNSYIPLFIVAGLAYVTALIVVQVLSPNLQPAKLD